MKAINKNILAVAKIASTDKINRPLLQGVLITPDHYIATDSVLMLEVSRSKDLDVKDFPTLTNQKLETSINRNIKLNAEQILKKIKFNKNKTLPALESAVLANENDDFVEVVTTDLESYSKQGIRKVKGGFPDFSPVIPEDKNCLANSLVDIELTIKLLKSMRECGDTSVEFSLFSKGQQKGGPYCPLKLKGNSGDTLGLIMPKEK